MIEFFVSNNYVTYIKIRHIAFRGFGFWGCTSFSYVLLPKTPKPLRKFLCIIKYNTLHSKVESVSSTTTSSATSLAEEHLKDVVWVHTTVTTTSATLINLLKVHSIVVHFFLLWVAQYSISLADVLKSCFSFLHCFFASLLMLVRMPFDCLNTIGFFNLRFSSIFANFQYFVVVFPFRFF